MLLLKAWNELELLSCLERRLSLQRSPRRFLAASPLQPSQQWVSSSASSNAPKSAMRKGTYSSGLHAHGRGGASQAHRFTNADNIDAAGISSAPSKYQMILCFDPIMYVLIDQPCEPFVQPFAATCPATCASSGVDLCNLFFHYLQNIWTISKR